jgi:hypothetical protein
MVGLACSSNGENLLESKRLEDETEMGGYY